MDMKNQFEEGTYGINSDIISSICIVIVFTEIEKEILSIINSQLGHLIRAAILEEARNPKVII